VLFDAQAARDVMQAFKRDGVDMMIDLEHQSLDAGDESRADASDARGWVQLTVRNGELWAVGVTWTVDGARRLKEKTQRYISPVVACDQETDRAKFVFNLALCAAPATHGAQALIAASRNLNQSQDKFAARVRAAKLVAKVKKARHGSR
jgi:phage I-like protein